MSEEDARDWLAEAMDLRLADVGLWRRDSGSCVAETPWGTWEGPTPEAAVAAAIRGEIDR